MKRKIKVNQINKLQNRVKHEWLEVPRTQDLKTWALLGLVSEVGEVSGEIKKAFRGEQLNTENLKEELGDTLHYLIALGNLYGWDLESLAESNNSKLDKRFPKGYSLEDAILKRDKRCATD